VAEVSQAFLDGFAAASLLAAGVAAVAAVLVAFALPSRANGERVAQPSGGPAISRVA